MILHSHLRDPVLSCDTVDQRYNLISLILLQGCSYGATEIGNVNGIGTAVATVLCASNTINVMYLSSPFVEKSFFCSSEESNQCCSPDTQTTHWNLLNTVLPVQYTYFTAKEAFHDVKGPINVQKLQHCKENQSVFLTIAGVKKYWKFYTEILLGNTTFLPRYSVQNQMHFQQEESVFFWFTH